MGPITAEILLGNPKDRTIQPMRVKALADTGALHLCPYVGPVEVKFENRGCFTGALVLGNEVLLDAVPMEDMDILLSPARQAVIVNPENPNIAGSIVKGLGNDAWNAGLLLDG